MTWGLGRVYPFSGNARELTSCQFTARRFRATANEVMTSCQLRESRDVPENGYTRPTNTSASDSTSNQSTQSAALHPMRASRVTTLPMLELETFSALQSLAKR